MASFFVSAGVCGVSKRQALLAPVHVPEEESQQKDHGERNNIVGSEY